MRCDVHPEEEAIIHLETGLNPGPNADCYEMCCLTELIELVGLITASDGLPPCGHDGKTPLWSTLIDS